MREGCDALTSDRVAPGGRQDGEVQLEVKPRAPVAGVELEFGTHRPDQLAADRETEPRAGEAIPSAPPGQPEGIVQAHERVGIDAGAGIGHRELDPRRSPDGAGDLDATPLRELERVGREVEEYSAERHRLAEPTIRLGRRQFDAQDLLPGHPPRDVRDPLQQLAQRERHWFVLNQLLAAAQLERVAHDSAQPERHAVDEPQLAVLQLVYRTALAALH